MTGYPQRIELMIDVFEQCNQPAFALAELLPTGLIAAILSEFTDLEYLSTSPVHYRLLRAEDNTPLEETLPLKDQVEEGCHLRLIEREMSLPAGTTAFSKSLYLREQESGQVFPLRWSPAIIGRASPNVEGNELVAVNLETHPAAKRVSRRHAQIIEENGELFLEALAEQNPVLLRRQSDSIPVEEGRFPLQEGDIIVLDRSEISLKLLVRNEG